MSADIRCQLAGIACVLLGCTVYLNSLDCGLCFDDQAVIVENQDLRSNQSWTKLFENDFWGVPISSGDSHKSYRPICVLTFRLNYLLHDLKPLGYHLANIALHGAVCYSYFQICSLILSSMWPTLIAGLLFAVHPIHTEAVTGVVGRADVLSGLFFTLCILAYNKSALSTKISSFLWLLTSLTFALCGALSKELGLTAVGVCIVYEFFVIRQMDWSKTVTFVGGGWRQSKWTKPFIIRLAVLASFTIVFLIIRVKINRGAPKFSAIYNPALFLPSPYRQLHWSYLSFFNLYLLLNPSHLCAEYAMSTIPPIKQLTDPRLILTFTMFVCIGTLAIYSIIKSGSCKRALLFGLSLLVLPYLPASNLFFPVGFVVAERVLYLPSMGLCLLVALGVWRIVCQRGLLGSLAKAGIIFVLIGYSVKTTMRNRDWFSDYSLFLAGVQVTPNNAKIINNLCAAMEGPPSPLSEALLHHAVKIEPGYVTNWMNLAETLRQSGRPLEAIKAYRAAANLVLHGTSNDDTLYIVPSNQKVFNSLSNVLREHTDNNTESLYYANTAIKFEPNWANSHHSKGKILLKMQLYNDAKLPLLEAVRLNPDYAQAHSNLGEVSFKLGELGLAEKHLRRSLVLDPHDPLTMFRLANSIAHLPRPTEPMLREAEKLLHKVLEVEPTNGNATFCLGLVTFDLGDLKQAEIRFMEALNISNEHTGSLYNLGVVLTQQNRWFEAIPYLKHLVSLKPDHVDGLSQLGTCYLQSGERQAAAAVFNRVLNEDPDHLQALQNLGVMMIQDHNFPMANELFSRLHELNPSDVSIKKQLEVLKKKL